jgi:hypothetical protein
MEFNLETIIAIVSSIASLGLFAVVKTLIKEIKEVVSVFKDAKSDGSITEREMNKIAKEAIDVIEEGIKVGYLVKKIFKFGRK